MARGYFLQGGYRGKLGETIGQAQNGKLIIKTYAKPKNPNSPAQRANRNLFSVANDYNNSLKMLGQFPALEGQAKSDYQSKNIKYFLENRKMLEKSLSPLDYKTYTDEIDGDVEWVCTIDDEYIVLHIEISIYEEEGELEGKMAAIGGVVYNYDEQKLYYQVTPPAKVKWTPIWGGYYEYIEDIIFEYDKNVGIHEYPAYMFVIYDGKRYNSNYQLLEIE